MQVVTHQPNGTGGYCTGYRVFRTLLTLTRPLTLISLPCPRHPGPPCSSCTMTSCKPCGFKDHVMAVGRLGPGPKAAVTWTFGSIQAVCMECLEKPSGQQTERERKNRRMTARFGLTRRFRFSSLVFTVRCRQFRYKYRCRSRWAQFKRGCRIRKRIRY